MFDVKCIDFDEKQKAAVTAGLLAAAKTAKNVKKNTDVIDVIDLLSDDEDKDNSSIPIKQLHKEERKHGTEYFAETVLPEQNSEIDNEECRSDCSSPLQFLEVGDCDFTAGNKMNGVVVPIGSEDTMPFPDKDDDVVNNITNSMQTSADVAYSNTANVTNVQTIPASFTPIKIKTPLPDKDDEVDNNITNSMQTSADIAYSNTVNVTNVQTIPSSFAPTNNVSVHLPIQIKIEALDEVNVKVEPMDFSNEPCKRDFNAIGLCMDDVIDLDDSDEEVDNDTKATIVHLIESDNEECNTDANALNNNVSMNMLFHYMCPECGVFCGSLTKWKAHTDIIHKFQAIEKLNLRTIISKDGSLRHQCKDCNKTFKLNGGIIKFIRHRIVHLPHRNYFKCRLCPSRFSNARSLNLHLNKDHEKIYKYYRKQTETNSFLNYICPICKELFNSRSTMVGHLNLIHNYKDMRYKDLYMPSENNGYICNICKKGISNKYVLNHTLTHEEHDAFQCKLCKEFSTKSSNACLQHVNEIHKVLPKRSSKCPYCDNTFKNSSMVWEHLQLTHGAKTVECKICNKTFRSSTSLWSHIQRSNHLKLK